MKRAPFVLAALLCLGAAPGLPPDRGGAGVDWPTHGGGADESGYSRLDQITTANVGRLGLAWSLDLPGEVTLEATPLAVGGVLYFTGTYSAVYAVEARSGRLLWRYDPQIWKHHPEKMRYCFAVNRGAAYAAGRVFAAAYDGRLIALDAKTGTLLWSVETVPEDRLNYITGAPRVFNGKVIIGNSGADYGARGYVSAYSAATGKLAWRFYTAPGTPDENKGDPAMERAAATWAGEYWKTGTGGTVWNGITFDPELNRVYIGTGNSGPYDPSLRSPGGGDNLYLASIVALDADTGKYVWHYQVNPREAWDYKATANIITATLSIDGRPRKVLMQAPTNGFFYVLDRETGKLISAEKTGKVTWAERIDLATGRPVEAPNIRYETGETVIWPSPLGTHNWQAMAFSPRAGLVFIPSMQEGARYFKAPPQPGQTAIGGVTIGLAPSTDPEDGAASLLAWDPVRRQAAWKVRLPTFWNGGALATAGDLVFQGTADGYLTAYDARSGVRLWRFDAGLGIEAAPISYSVGGRQYVSVLTGWGGSAPLGRNSRQIRWKYGAQPRRLLTFVLGGKAALPPTAPADTPLKALDDPTLQKAPADVAAGGQLFAVHCGVCHGYGLRSGGSAPDLRESPVALRPEGLWSVVHEGALLDRGMPRFDELTQEQVRQLHAYIREGARQALRRAPAPDGF
jgi:quinohemoprotein ethanol dehydrogenase